MTDASESVSANEQQERQPEETPRTGRLPPPSLKTFLSGLAGQVLIDLGLFDNPVTGKRQVNLEQAKYTIDLLQILHDKMQGNLSEEEDRLLRSMLYDLRMRYVEACR